MGIWQELRRRRVFRVAGLYIVGCWLAFQVAATFFPAWNIPDTALRYLLIAAVAAFPIALVFGWMYDLTPNGIVRTVAHESADDTELSLKRSDYFLLAGLCIIVVAVGWETYDKVRESTDELIVASEKAPNSIAVLPFDNLEEDDDTEYFSDGITDEILHRLSSYGSLRVLGRSSSFSFKGSDTPLPRISDILRVRYLLQGSVRRNAENIRITAELVDENGFHVWSETFEKRLDNIIAIQSEIAASVARSLVAEISPRAERTGSTTRNVDAYQQYLIGRDYFLKRPAHWADAALAAYQRAIDLDPEFAPPYAGLAVATGIGGGNVESYAGRLRSAQAAAATALRLDAELGEAHAAQGLMLMLGRSPDFAAAESALRRALQLDPTIVSAYNWLSNTLTSQGKLDDAWAVRLKALEIDPLDPIINSNMANTYSSRGDFWRARSILLRQMDLPQPAGNSYYALFHLYQGYGHFVEANTWAKKKMLAYSRSGSERGAWDVSWNYRYLGMDEEAEYWHTRFEQDNNSPLVKFVSRAFALKLTGRFDDMQQLLTEIENRQSIDVSQLPIFTAEVIAAINIITGNYEEGAAIIESLLIVDGPRSYLRGGGIQELDFIHMQVFAYQQMGRDDEALILLETIAEQMQSVVDLGLGRYPRFFEILALNQAMRGHMEDAARSIEDAVDAGWRDYVFVQHDPRWQNLLADPRVQSAMAFVKSDIERQRLRVKAMDDAQDFRLLLEQRIAPAELTTNFPSQ